MASPVAEVVFVRPSTSGRLYQRQVLFGTLGVVLAAAGIGASRSAPVTVVLVLALVAVGSVVVTAVVGTRLELHPDRMVVRRAYSSAAVRWVDVAAVHLEWWSLRDGAGYSFRITWMPEIAARSVALPPLSSGAVGAMKTYVSEHFIPVLINPTEPWMDRSALWHGEGHQYDPFESIRSIRSAAVGPWLVRVLSTEGGFHAMTSNVSDGEVIIEGPVRATRAEATTDGESQIRQCASDLLRRRM
jgi:hypothetical protein